MAVPHGFNLSVGAIGIRVSCDAASLAERLDRYLLPWAPRQADSAAEVEFTVTAAREPGRFAIHERESLVSAGEEWPHVFVSLQHAVDAAILRRLSGFALVHAGVVAVGGAAILLPGASGAGKTTLVRELAQRGAEYFSDEYALLDREGRVHPYPRALMLRDGAGVQQPVLPEELNPHVGTQAVHAAFVLALTQARRGAWELRRLSASEGLMCLLRNTPHVLAEKPEILAPLRAAAAHAAFYEGSRGEAGEAAGEILRLAEST